ncbi:Putative transmembrane protein [Neorhizobium galegae bv. orientalis]|nr:hypothetical protein [Neorhizobium galegae]MCQ1835101.1 hypothetical protein [Neorhizobium galegae]CDZ64911.1 Putative transmembrane protein [Neorhizobium galegae bv. orientalis]
MIVASANQRLSDILVKLPKHKSQWELNVASPYVRAYDAAVLSYNNEMKAQGERDRATAEMFVLAASILTGSVMMAAFATTSVRVLAGRAIVRVICNNNLNRTFNLMAAANNNKAFMFALGGVLDEAKKVANKQVTKLVEGLTSTGTQVSAPTSVNYESRLMDFIRASHICTHEFIEGVKEDNSISEAHKGQVADMAARIPFCNPPTGSSVDERKLAEKMELLFYMSAVLDSDRLVTYAPSYGGSVGAMGRETEYDKKSISQMPSEPRYPKAVSPKFAGRPFVPYDPGQRIEYENIGSGIRDRINKLSISTHNGPFYPNQNLAERMLFDPTGHAQMMKAEQIINKLYNDARPRQLTEVRMI